MNNNISPLNYKSLKLFGFEDYFDEIQDLLEKKKLPKVSLLSGKKGIGKSTLIFHLLNYFFSKNDYNLNHREINSNSVIFKQITAGTFQNIVYLGNYEVNNLKIDDVRYLKKLLLKTTLNNKPRFIIIDDSDLMSLNSANALLKLIEEPSDKNYFILIDNKQRPIIETISSRCLKTNVFINNENKNKIINSILKFKNLESSINYIDTDITPGQFLHFNEICLNNQIHENTSYDIKLDCLLKLYKKEENKIYIDMSVYFTDQYFYKLSLLKKNDPFLLNASKLNIINQINNFVTYNLNLNSVLNLIQRQFIYEK